MPRTVWILLEIELAIEDSLVIVRVVIINVVI
jgi:hypothetical protein